MKPAPFEYYAATSLDDAVRALDEAGDAGKAVAGGQSLLALMNLRLARPELLVDLNALSELDHIETTPDGGLRIGAMTRQRTLEFSAAVAERCPVMAEALPHVAHAAIRNRGTIGGSLAHADSGSELCTISLAVDARLRVRAPRGDREIVAADFFAGPFTTVLAENEVLAEVVIPPARPRTGHSFREVARRRGDFALAGVAAVVSLGADGAVEHARLAYTSLGPSALRAPHAEEALRGTPAEDEAIARAVALLAEDLAPNSDLHASAAFRMHLAEVLTRRAVQEAVQRAKATLS